MSEESIVRFSKWSEVPGHLVSATEMKKRGLVPGVIRGQVYQKSNHQLINLYDVNEALPKRPATSKQLAAIEKARAVMLAKRTCRRCGGIFSKLLNNQLCDYCDTEAWLDTKSEEALRRFRQWVEHKCDFAVLDVETTGLDDDAEIVEIAVVDLDETVLFHSLVKPSGSISPEATAVHGITDTMLIDAPEWTSVWPEVRRLFERRRALIFNGAFDSRIIARTCRKYGFPAGLIDHECVMEAYARYVRSYSYRHRDFTWVGLSDAAMQEKVSIRGAHRAVEDSRL
jgi:DNA polymerase-3 subunit epsilon